MFPVFASRTRFEAVPPAKAQRRVVRVMVLVFSVMIQAVVSKAKVAVSHIAVFVSVSEEAEAIADFFFASVHLAHAILERSNHRTGKKGATRGTNDV